MLRILNLLGLLPPAVRGNRHLMFLIVSCAAFGVVTSIVWMSTKEFGVILVLSIAFVVIIAMQIVVREEQSQNYCQLESLFSLHSLLELRAPLPRMRGWAISPDFANLLVTLVSRDSPKVVVEAGCGASTVILAYCLEKLDNARLYSLEHDSEYAARMRATLSEHRLDGVVQIIDSPLKRYELDGRSWLSYDLDSMGTINEIDLLIIDGPPAHCQRQARYPVLPLLRNRLSGNAVVVLDDASRRDERRILAKWQKKFSDFSLETISLEEGAAVLRRNNVGA